MNIDYERLKYSLLEVLNDSDSDVDVIVRNAELCWDDTAIKVKGTDFEFIFDLISYDCLNVNTNDLEWED